MPSEYIQVYTANGQLEAEMIRLFLESKEIQAVAYGESLGSVYGLTVGPLGEVKIMVPAYQAENARQILKDMEDGKYERNPFQTGSAEEPASEDDEIN